MTKFEVIGYGINGIYAEIIDATDSNEALKLGKRLIKTWLPKGVKILKWVVRTY